MIPVFYQHGHTNGTHTIKAGKKYKKKCVNLQRNSQNWPEGAVKGQKFAFSLLKINNTIAGRDGLDKYQL